jgi:NADH-quinone oxidoreductase subunit F
MGANLIVSAIGQKPDLTFLTGINSLSISERGLIKVDADTLATSQPGIFAAGDNVTGPATVIDALAAGKRAAISIDRYLRGKNLEQWHQENPEAGFRGEKKIWWCEITRDERQKIPQLPIEERSFKFDEVELGLTQQLAIKEASRCLKCGIFAYMDLKSCCGESCCICKYHCQTKAIRSHYD